jgi:hypothetical protein
MLPPLGPIQLQRHRIDQCFVQPIEEKPSAVVRRSLIRSHVFAIALFHLLKQAQSQRLLRRIPSGHRGSIRIRDPCCNE